MSIKRMFVVFGAVILIASGVPAYAQTKPAAPPAAVMTAPGVNDALKAIREDQQVARNDQINPDKVSDTLLARLGDAVAAQRFPDQRQHAWLENMMGGAGSKNLSSLYTVMGYNYLTGRSDGRYPGDGGWGMMGGPGRRDGMGGRFGMMGPYGMMGWARMRALWIVPGVIGLILVILLIVFIVMAATRRSGGAAMRLEILKTRLAKGEITKEEFDRLKGEVK